MNMRCLIFAVVVGAMPGFSQVEDIVGQADNIFSDDLADPAGNVNMFSADLADPSQNVADQTLLASNDANIFSSDADANLLTDSSLLLAASTCDDRAKADGEGLLASKLRARDPPSVCYSKDSQVQGLLNRLPRIFGGKKKEPVPDAEPVPAEQQYFGRHRLGNYDKCWPPYKFNLCCNGNVDGDIDSIFFDELAIPPSYFKVEDCYESMSMCLSTFPIHF